MTIIGGGPAGTTAAVALLRRGWEVRLIEQHLFPRDKVCGECVSAVGLGVLQRLSLLEPLAALGAVALRRALLHSAAGDVLSVPLPRPMWGVSRRAMDSALLQAAVEGGATVLQPVRCEGLEVERVEMRGSRAACPQRGLEAEARDACQAGALLDDDATELCSHRLTLRDLRTNRIQWLDSSLTLLADGKGMLLPNGPMGRAPTGDLGIKVHFTDVEGPRDAVELFGLAGHYGGLAAIEPEAPGGRARWNAAFAVPARHVKKYRGDLPMLLGAMIDQNPALRQRLGGARRSGPILASPLPRFDVVRDWPPGVIPIGNAAAALEPIGGEGMGLAMRSAELAAIACEQVARRGQARGHLPGVFGRLWNPRRVACRVAARVMSVPLLSQAMIDLGVHNESAVRAVLHWMGKTADEA